MLFSIAMRLVLCALLALGLQAAAGQAAKQDADEFMRAGIAAEQHGDNRSAIEDFRKALAKRPDLIDARIALGVALAATGQLDSAIDEDTRALQTAPDRVAVRMNLGLAYYKKGDLAHARQQFETVHLAEPANVQAAVLLGYVFIKLGREVDAVDLLTPLEVGHESNMDLEYVLAFSFIETGDNKDGIPRMEKYAQVTRTANAYVIAGSALLNQAQMVEAQKDLLAARQVDPSIPGLPTMIGQTEFALGEMTDATLEFQKALQTNPRDFDANLDLGAIRLKERNFQGARPLLELALELRPTIPLARIEMAKLNNATGRFAEAAPVLEDLAKANPTWLDAHWELATAYFGLNRPEDGKRERQIAQKLRDAVEQAKPDNK
jgi:tetratricopeptide (TPR) repeat protein